MFPFPGDRTTQLHELRPCGVILSCLQASLPATLWFFVSGPCLSNEIIVLALLQNPGSAGEHSSQLKNKLVVTMKGRSCYTFFQIAVNAFTPMVTLERIFLWNYHPYREAEGLARERVGHWTILRAVATPVPESKSNPIQSKGWGYLRVLFFWRFLCFVYTLTSEEL